MFLKFCEDQLLSANLNNAKNVLKEADHNSMTAELTHGSRELAVFLFACEAVLEGQRLEDMRDEAATEVFRACRACGGLEL